MVDEKLGIGNGIKHHDFIPMNVRNRPKAFHTCKAPTKKRCKTQQLIHKSIKAYTVLYTIIEYLPEKELVVVLYSKYRTAFVLYKSILLSFR